MKFSDIEKEIENELISTIMTIQGLDTNIANNSTLNDLNIKELS